MKQAIHKQNDLLTNKTSYSQMKQAIHKWNKIFTNNASY